MALASIKKKFRKGGTVSIGTNEEIEYSDSDEVMNDVSITEISKQDYDTISRLFGTSFGETGPCSDFDDYDEDFEEDEELEEDSDDYDNKAEAILNFIKKEFNLEEDSSKSGHCYGSFYWKPTPKTNIEIVIPSEDDGEEEVEVTLKLNGRELQVEFIAVEDVYDNLSYVKTIIEQCVKKANKF
jgi:hypothetical protein